VALFLRKLTTGREQRAGGVEGTQGNIEDWIEAERARREKRMGRKKKANAFLHRKEWETKSGKQGPRAKKRSSVWDERES